MNLHLHAIVYIIIFLCAAAVFLLAWPRRKTSGGKFFIFHLITLAIWDFGLLCEAESTSIATKVFWSQISYLGFVFVTPLLYLFVLEYTSQEKVRFRSFIVLMIIPALVLVAAWTNNLHHLLWTSFTWGSEEFNTLIYGHGVIFYVNIIYIYFLVTFGIAVLARSIPRNQPPFRSQLIVILAAIIFPMISGGMYVFNYEPIPGMDISIFGFLMTNIILTFGFIHYRLLDLVPVANDSVIQHLQDGMIVVDWRRRLVKINDHAVQLMQLPEQNYLGKNINEIFPTNFDLEQLLSGRSPVELSLGQPPTRYLDLRSARLTADAANSPGNLVILRDITPQKEAEINLHNANQNLKIQLDKINGLQSQLRDQALHDPLTGLFNFRGMDEILESLLDQSKLQGRPFSILVMDIDHFKRVNDVFGHQTGNYLLQEYGKLIQTSIRKDDFACRFGGDEIMLGFEGMPADAAFDKAEEIREGIKKIEVEKNQSRIFTTVSIGLASYPVNGATIKELISAADQAMYDAKEHGRDAVVKSTAKPNVSG
jgi:diguanylate cyclase (GGDEF)-like protein